MNLVRKRLTQPPSLRATAGSAAVQGVLPVALDRVVDLRPSRDDRARLLKFVSSGADRRSGFKLEGERDARAEGNDLSFLDPHVQLHHLGNPKVAERIGC